MKHFFLLFLLVFFQPFFLWGAYQEFLLPVDIVTSKEASKLDPVSLLAAKAAKEYARGDFTAAEKTYQQATALDPNQVLLLNYFAATELHLAHHKKAEELLLQSLQKKLANPLAWLLLGMMSLEEQHNKEAFAALVQATLYDPKNARAQNYLGIAAEREHWNDISEASLCKAIELDPTYADAHFNLAVYYLRRSPPALEIARRHYQRAIELGATRDPKIDEAIK
ncbi:MAG: tetratricopeptide repeat protein [Chthoniobacterales bacterium]|nr:tetratricopeptide repeat protein [Chthoniobacterales bacterium]